jgi:hypothetical protein
VRWSPWRGGSPPTTRTYCSASMPTASRRQVQRAMRPQRA